MGKEVYHGKYIRAFWDMPRFFIVSERLFSRQKFALAEVWLRLCCDVMENGVAESVVVLEQGSRLEEPIEMFIVAWEKGNKGPQYWEMAL